MDCRETENYLKEKRRMCETKKYCDECPFYDVEGMDCFNSSATKPINAKEAIATVQKWSDEHPRKTYAQDFFEKFPKAQSKLDGSPFVCRKRIYCGARPAFKDCDYTGSCKNCWNEPMEAADDE